MKKLTFLMVLLIFLGLVGVLSFLDRPETSRASETGTAEHLPL